MVGVDESQGESKAAKSNTQSVLQAYQQYKQQTQQSTPQASAYSNIKGYDPTQPANSAYNRTILSYNSAGVPYDILSTGSPAPSPQQSSVFTSSTKPDPALAKAASIGFQSVEVYDKSGGVIATLPIGSANDKLNSLANQFGEISYKPVNQKSINPEEESLLLQSLQQNPQILGKVITSRGSYLNSLVAQGVLTSEDIDKINAISGTYTNQVNAQNANARQNNIQASFKQQADIKAALTKAQQAGITSLNILDANGKVVGTVNPQNIGQANLQTLKLVSRSGGVSIQGSAISTDKSVGVETTLTTPTYREDPLSLFTRPIAALGASIALPIWEALTTGKIQPSPGLSLFTSGNIGLSEAVSGKIENLTGISEEVQKAASGQYKGGSEAAALAGIVASVAIPTVAGMSGIGKVPEFAGLSARFQGKTVIQTIPNILKAFRERELVIRPTENVGATKAFEQGTEQAVSLKESPYQAGQLSIEKLGSKTVKEKIDIGGGKTVETFEKVPSGSKVQVIKAQFPKGFSGTEKIEMVGQTGTEKPSLFPEYNYAKNLQLRRSISLLGQKLGIPSKNLALRVVTDTTPGAGEAFGFVETFNTKDVFIAASSKNKGAFTPENISDTLSHESLHNAIQEATGEEKASYSLDNLLYKGEKSREMNFKLLDLGISPTTLEPKYEPATNLLSDETLNENIADFNKINKSLLSKTFEGQTQPKHLYGKVIKEVPKTLTVQESATGPATLHELFVSDKQVATWRTGGTILEKGGIMIERPSPELKATLGLEPVPGTKDVFQTKATEGTMDYLKAAQKAGLVSEQVGEIHVSSREDLIKNPQGYMELSRNPELFQSAKETPENLSAAFGGKKRIVTDVSNFKEPQIVRPKVFGYYISTPLKTQTFGKGVLTPRPYKKPSSPFPGTKESLRQQTIKEIKPNLSNFHNIGNKQEVILKERPLEKIRPTGSEQLQRGMFETKTTPTQIRLSTINPTILRPAGKPQTKQKTKPVLGEGQKEIIVPDIGQKIREGFRSRTEELTRPVSKPIIRTIPKFEQTPVSKVTTTPIQKITTVQASIQSQYQGLEQPTPQLGKPQTPENKRFGGLVPGLGGPLPGGLGRVGKSGSRKTYHGNVPYESIIGIYNRSEISYSNKAEKLSKATKPNTKLSRKKQRPVL